MERTIHNPWTWQDDLGFVQAVEITGPSKVLECSGQVSFAADGSTLHSGDMAGQISAALDNLESVLGTAEMTLANVAKVTTYVTDMAAYFEHRDLVTQRFEETGGRHTHTLIGVSDLARPDILVEIDAVAYS